MDNLTKFIKFLEKLEDKNIYYKLNKIREDSIMVEVTIPGQRWEIEYNTYDNGSNYIIEIEKFISNGTIYGESELETLFKDYSN